MQLGGASSGMGVGGEDKREVTDDGFLGFWLEPECSRPVVQHRSLQTLSLCLNGKIPCGAEASGSHSLRSIVGHSGVNECTSSSPAFSGPQLTRL